MTKIAKSTQCITEYDLRQNRLELGVQCLGELGWRKQGIDDRLSYIRWPPSLATWLFNSRMLPCRLGRARLRYLLLWLGTVAFCARKLAAQATPSIVVRYEKPGFHFQSSLFPETPLRQPLFTGRLQMTPPKSRCSHTLPSAFLVLAISFSFHLHLIVESPPRLGSAARGLSTS
ncbi:hypothetical protein F5144DRAFT_161703 [Chaetomium tenue]|uniref:Uncharacterized protein n=1 Tax=Chaetomium tenue TaxID=1854479 RepID=A0ACB7P9X5_9PEZI|nr:hypothetical protein F5144DRAFT_161703 [Chaetomium globosum]